MNMNLLKFGWRNTWRNKRRTILTLAAIVFGVMAIIFARGYLAGILNSAGDEMVKTQLGHVKIAHEEFLRLERIMPRESLVTDAGRLGTDLAGIPGVSSVIKQLKFHALLDHSGINETGVTVGIEPRAAEQALDLSKTIIQGQYFGSSDLEAVIGKKLAEKLDVKVNDEILLVTTDINYSTYSLPFKVVGIFETGFSALDKYIVYIPLVKAQEILDCGDAAHEVLVFLKDPQEADAVKSQVLKLLQGMEPKSPYRVITWKESDFIKNFLPTVEKVMGRVMQLFLIIVALVILNTMLMALMERYHEIGVLKALGFKDSEVVYMIFIEALYIGTIGSVIGGLLGGAITAITQKTGIDLGSMIGQANWEKLDFPVPFFTRIMYPQLNSKILVGSIFFGIVVAVAAVIYPALKSRKMTPVQAFRSKLQV
ncbi:MAG: ABC transporter permease [Candidatus Aminicenantes bacterium]|jgi:putative ABC transport system permease protein